MRTRLLIAGPLAMIASLLLATSAMAGVGLTVTTTADNSAGPSDHNGQCTLREAITASNSGAGTDDCPSSGTPPENQIGFAAALGAHPVITLGAFGDLQVGTNDVTITGPATVMGADNSGFRVITSNGINLTLTSLTISNGSEDTGADGGGIKVIGGRLFLNSSSVTGNTETATTTSGSKQAQGGGIFSNGAPVTLIDSNVSNNQAIASFTGAGTGNVLALGGGMEVSGDDVTLDNSVVSDNKALASHEGTGSLEGDGGGIRTDGGVLIEHSTISGNLGSATATGTASIAAQGGGLLVHDGPGIDLELSTIANNQVKVIGGTSPVIRGGGVEDQVPNADDNFISDTIVGNGLDPASSTASVSGLNFNSVGIGTGSRNFSNTIIANPVGSAGTNCSGDTPYATSGAPNDDFPLDVPNACFAAGMAIMNLDPLLGALGSNGGSTPTMVPSAKSPVIDKGIASDQNDLTEDQRGLTRPVAFSGLIHPFDGSDIGAVEVQRACTGQATPSTQCPGPPGPPSPGPPASSPSSGPTGQRAAAKKHCKKLKGKAKAKKRKKCIKHAKRLPV
jgi:CSLREA domain-containing protein